MKNTAKLTTWKNHSNMYIRYHRNGKTRFFNTNIHQDQKDTSECSYYLSEMFSHFNSILNKYNFNNGEYPDIEYMEKKWILHIKNNTDDIISLYKIYELHKKNAFEKGEITKNTFVNSVVSLGKHLMIYNDYKKININKFDTEFVKDILNFFQYEYKHRSKQEGNGLNNNTIITIKNRLKPFIKYIFFNELVDEHKIDWDVVKIRYEKPEKQVVRLDEYKFLWNKRNTEVEHKKCLDMFLLSLHTGVRYSDLIRISKDDIIDGKLKMVNQKGKTIFTIPLNKYSKQILIDNDYNLNLYNNMNTSIYNKALRKMLKSYVDECPSFNEEVDKFIFKGKKSIRKTIKRYEDCASHTGRVSWITHADNLGFSIKDIQSGTGQLTASITNGYIQKNKEVDIPSAFEDFLEKA